MPQFPIQNHVNHVCCVLHFFLIGRIPSYLPLRHNPFRFIPLDSWLESGRYGDGLGVHGCEVSGLAIA